MKLKFGEIYWYINYQEIPIVMSAEVCYNGNLDRLRELAIQGNLFETFEDVKIYYLKQNEKTKP